MGPWLVGAAVALGGALGALARWGMGGWVQRWAGQGFPWGTLAVNVLGSLGIGVALRGIEAAALPAEARAFVVVGFLGAFTTFSTFGAETLVLLRDGAWARAAAYVLGSVLLGLAAVGAGLWLARGFGPAR